MVIECPHCHRRVLPTVNNICPACRIDIADTSGVDPNVVSLTIRESDELPPYCYSCNSYTERFVKIKGDEQSEVAQAFLALAGIIFFRPQWVIEDERDTPNVIVHLPQCKQCAQYGKPEPLRVDFEDQTMTFLVNNGFRERVHPVQEIKPDSGIDINEEESE